MRNIISALFLLSMIYGCNDEKSLKPKSQLDFENELKKLHANVSNSGAPGTRAYEAASNQLVNFWTNKKASLRNIDGWVCVYTDSIPWEPKRNIYDGQYILLRNFCGDADKSFNQIRINTGSTIGFTIPVSKAQNIEPLYAGDIIAITGVVNTPNDLESSFFSYQLDIQANSVKIIKKGK